MFRANDSTDSRSSPPVPGDRRAPAASSPNPQKAQGRSQPRGFTLSQEGSAWARASGAGLIRRGILTYVCGLLLIASLTIAGHFITDSIVRQQEATARVINLSGRQRMLSQRIAKLSLERAAHLNLRSDAEITATLRGAIAQMAAAHQILLHGSEEQHIQPPPPATLAIYEKRPYLLDTRIRIFLTQSRRLADLPPEALTLQNSDLINLERNAQEPLLGALDAAVSAYQATSEASIQNLRRTLVVLLALMLMTLLAEALWLYRPLFKRLESVQRRLFDIGRTDPLTGCFNRRAFSLESQRSLVAALLKEQPLSILMADIDHFKAVNDRFGHPAGDLVINSVVATLLRSTAGDQIVGRMGGEEFAVLLRGTGLAQAIVVAEELRAAVEATVIQPSGLDLNGQDLSGQQAAGLEPTSIAVTVSVGVASLESDDDTSIFQLLARADKALYRAKRTGRNRVTADISAEILAPLDPSPLQPGSVAPAPLAQTRL